MNSTRSFSFQKSLFSIICAIQVIYLVVIDFYDSHGDSFLHFVCHFVQTQKRRVGEAHVGPAGEQERIDGPAGRSHEAPEGTILVGQKFGSSFPMACMTTSFIFSFYTHFFSLHLFLHHLCLWRVCFHSLSSLIFWLTGWRAETGSKCSFTTAQTFWSKHTLGHSCKGLR